MKPSKAKREPIALGRWFMITRALRHTCCRCGSRHTFKFRLRNGVLEMKVLP